MEKKKRIEILGNRDARKSAEMLVQKYLKKNYRRL